VIVRISWPLVCNIQGCRCWSRTRPWLRWTQ
jgi:hypothetical protein